MKSMASVQDPVTVTQPTSNKYQQKEHYVSEKENHGEKDASEDLPIIPENNSTTKFLTDDHETKLHKVSDGKSISILHFDPTKSQKTFTICHEGFNTSTRTLLSTHKQIHLGEETHWPVSDEQLNLNAKGTQDVQLDTHSKSRRFSCPVCKEAFVSLQALQSHIKTNVRIHKTDRSIDDSVEELSCPKKGKRHACSFCSKTWKTRYDLIKHVRTHTGEKPFKCSVCLKSFTSISSLYRHEKKNPYQECYKTSKKDSREFHSEKEQKLHRCSFCNKIWKTNYDLTKHLRTHTGEKPFKCSVCLKSFTSISSLYRHEKRNPYQECYKTSTVPEEAKKDSREFHSEKEQKLHRCSFCNKIWKTNYDLTKHLRIHTGEKPFKCSVCSIMFNTSSSLYRHMMRKKHNEYSKTSSISERRHGIMLCVQKPKKDARKKKKNPSYTCSFCGVTCKRHHDLIRHKKTHTGENTVKCSMCLKVFSTSTNMNRHMKTHHKSDHCKTSIVPVEGTIKTLHSHHRSEEETGEFLSGKKQKLHRCSFCSKTWKSNSDLIKHFRIHTGEKPFKCSLCSKVFVYSSSLYRHMREIHDDFKAEKDAKEFSLLQKGTKPLYTCSFCGITWRSHSDLIKHERIHTGEKPFKCSMCLKLFRTSSSMYRHMKSYHNHDHSKNIECDTALSVDENLKSETNVDAEEKTSDVENDVSEMCCETDCTKCDCVEHLPKNKEKENSSSSVLNDSDGLDTQQSIAEVVNNSSEIYDKTSSNSNVERKDIAYEIMNLELECESVIDEENNIEKQSEDDTYECSFCQKTFMTKNCLQQHIQMHAGENSYKCSKCDETFACENSLDCHLKVHAGNKYYNCLQCPKSFQGKHDFVVHVRVHSREKPYQCVMCDMRFCSSGGLNNHKIRIHKVFKDSYNLKSLTNGVRICEFQCSICEENFKWNRIFMQHFKQHNESFTEVKPYKCSRCSLTYFTVKGVQRHTRSHSRVKVKRFKCSLCSRSFNGRHDLDCHVQTHTGEIPYQCSICGLMWRQSSQLYKHMRLHKKDNSRVSGGLNHIDSEEKQHKCHECFESFHEEHDLGVHMKIHTGEKSYICSICRDTFCTSGGLEKHTLENHKADHISSVNCNSQIITDPSRISSNGDDPNAQKTIFMDSSSSSKALDDSDSLQDRNISVKKSKGRITHESGQKIILEMSLDQSNADESHVRDDSSYKCSLCSQTFTTESCLQQHNKTHSTKNSYSCFKWDGTGTSTFENSINRHLKIHSEEKSHQCLDCSSSFRDKYDLIIHMRNHTGERPYQCLMCDKNFSRRSSLKRHMKLHNADIEIDRSRISESDDTKSVEDDGLDSNSNTFDVGDCMEVDAGESSYLWEKQYKCSECSKSFHTKYHLVCHTRTHTGEKPYQCSKCNKTFSLNSNLKKHIRRHEKNEMVAKYLV